MSSLGSMGRGPSMASGPPGPSGQSVLERAVEVSGTKRDTAITPNLSMVASSVLVLAVYISCAILTLVTKIAWIFEPSSVQNITANLSVDGSTSGNPIQKWKRKIDANCTARLRTLSSFLPCPAR